MTRKPIIAIDGPAGAGKTTAARNLAEKLGFVYLDTGATFRAVALKAMREGVSLDDEKALLDLAKRSDIAFGGERFEKILLDGEDVSRAIREPPVALASSRVAVHPGVRALLVRLWRRIGESGGVILEGRDIGTDVFPDAEIKFFLDAGHVERAGRRFREQGDGSKLSLEGVTKELQSRDETDRNRAHSPLRRADDAILVDTTHLTPEETLRVLLREAQSRLQEADLT
ncbi:MAG TPA: (d)CMP kinase [Vicinamibacteria bacterium]|jgi:cytidylate kinase